MNFQGRADIVQELSRSYEVVRVLSDVNTSSMITIWQSPEKFAMQRRTAAQAHKIQHCKDKSCWFCIRVREQATFAEEA